MIIVQLAFLLLFPYAAIRISRVKKLRFVSPILLCYLVGMVLGNLKPVPLDKSFSMTMAEFAVPFAIPLVLFATDFAKWFRLARNTIISFCLVIVSAVVSAAAGALVFSRYIDEYWINSSMLTGVYTGGTPNLVAIGMGLGVSENTMVLVNTSDAIAGGLYFLFLVGPAKWLLSKFLPPFRYGEDIKTETAEFERNTPFLKMERKEMLERAGQVLLIMAASVVIVGVSAGISMLIKGGLDVAIVMLSVTTFSIAASFIKRIRRIKGTYEIGQYLILVFSLAIGTTVDFGSMLKASPTILIFTLFVMTIAIVIHYILAMFFRIDTDTAIITSTAGIFGPAFIVPVANALKNREVIVSGLTTGLVGYAVGNYLGFMLAYFIRP